MKTYLCFDMSNMLHRSFYAGDKNDSDDVLAGLATHTALIGLNKYYKMHKPDAIVMAFDRRSWRKDYTASELCISKKQYKGNRRKDMSPAQQAKYQRFMQHMSEFESLITSHTSVISLAAELLEADDLLGGFAKRHSASGDRVIIITTDSDMLQLAKYPNVIIFSPATDKEHSLGEFYDDAEYYLFQKCVRGDSTDNIQSAYPRVRATKIKEAYDDEYARVRMMKETWTNENNIEFVVEELFEENQLLIDLDMQPDTIKKLIDTTISEAETRNNKFSLFHILKYVGKHDLKTIRDNIDQYVPMLSKR